MASTEKIVVSSESYDDSGSESYLPCKECGGGVQKAAMDDTHRSGTSLGEKTCTCSKNATGEISNGELMSPTEKELKSRDGVGYVSHIDEADPHLKEGAEKHGQQTTDLALSTLVIPEEMDLSDYCSMACDQTKIIPNLPSKPPKVYQNFPGKTALWYGLAQIVLGVIAISMQALAISDSEPTTHEMDGYNYFSTGVWCGIFFILTGIITLLAAKKKTHTLVNGSLIMSGMACGLFTLCLLVMGAVVLYFVVSSHRCQPEVKGASCKHKLVIVHATLITTAVLEFAVASRVAIMCYKTLHKEKRTKPGGFKLKSSSRLGLSAISNHREFLYVTGQNSPRRSETPSLSSRPSRTGTASRTPTDGASNEGYEADESYGTLNSVSSHWSTLTKSDQDNREGSAPNGTLSHRRTSSLGSFSSNESNCVVVSLPDPYDKITELEEEPPKRPYYNSNEGVDLGTGKSLLSNYSNGDAASTARSVTDSAYEEMSEDSFSTPEYPRVIVNCKDSDDPHTIIISAPIRL